MNIKSISALFIACAALVGSEAAAQSMTPAAKARAIDAFIAPYVATNNFSGQILVQQGATVLYRRNLGFADRSRQTQVSSATRFHIASVSMQLTVAAMMRLVDQGKLSLDTRVSDVVPWLRGSERITVRNLLEQRSGLSDINARSDYNEILTRHQTPTSLVRIISNDSLLFPPGTKYLHEEHSAANVQALIIERETGRNFPRAMDLLLFKPLGLTHSAVDDDKSCSKGSAVGYAPSGVAELTPAAGIHWSAKAGNASACTTADDLAKWIRTLFHGTAFTARSRDAILDSAGPSVGFGWFRRPSTRFKEFAYSMNGRAPGFASYVLYLPREDLTVIALSNIYSSATTEIGSEIAAIAVGIPYTPIAFKVPLLPADSLGVAGLSFKFPADFYQPNATITFVQKAHEMFLAWPSGEQSPLIPVDRDHFVDRAYWEPVTVVRDSAGRPTKITYDRFTGDATSTASR